MDYKIVFLGHAGVGKSSIVHRIKYNNFTNIESTIGAAFVSYIDDKTSTKLSIWDTAGQEKYDSLTPIYYRNAELAVVVYSSTDHFTYNKAKLWIQKIKETNDKCHIILVENKIDLYLDSDKPLELIVNETTVPIIKVSAKTGQGIQNLIECMVQLVKQPNYPRETISLEGQNLKLGPSCYCN
jgi:small GTP-binding protein